MRDEGFAKVSRKLLSAPWYYSGRSDVKLHTRALYLHCLLKANWTTGIFEGITIRRGEFPTSLQKLSEEMDLSVRQVRSCLLKLEDSGYLKSRIEKNIRIISVCDYDCSANFQNTLPAPGNEKKKRTSEKTRRKNKGIERGTDFDAILLESVKSKISEQ